ncbi:sulfite exporter TauE/SafE family protein [Aquisalinus flavus]|uniref:Probable membrane transporter protein n=1 Tax=Aquisalinus flavus TaxID=1526572 RepID=A0A8J2Y7F0_9PROT|nr:sulfite exporter TauE/SafE family protein [Aquisalinus flavus]MBD0425710.1 sulfite exporter TauE/SafE family protein [Aquisalinus flavus]UNE48678.1 sulfite exporter TauE/SafE family protein [Aquisalinus flavus]GGD13905.1 hypothetical protein GCM10011342_23310 [Aquisalinus flavus]
MDMPDFLPTFLPGDLTLWQAIIVILVSLIGAAMTAATSIGGGLLLVAIMSAFFPPAAVIPVHAVIMIGSNAGRSVLLLNYVNWRIWGWFVVGLVAGALVGSQVVFSLPAEALRLAIAAFILFTQWGPKIGSFVSGEGRKGSIVYIVTGAISTFLTLFVGATGPFMTAVLSKDRLTRQEIVATAGVSMTFQHTVKVFIFGFGGFLFAPWLPFIGLCVLAGFIGSFIGTRVLHTIDEALYRSLLKWILTGIAAYLVLLVLF